MQTPSNRDPWVLSGDGYSPERFYVRSTDGHGHDTTITVKISPALMGQLQHIIQSRQVPDYRTNADVVRDALIHRMRWLHDNMSSVVNLADLEVEQRQAELDRVATQRDAWNHYLQTLDEQLTDLIRNREFDEAEWIMDQNTDVEAMTPPFLKKLGMILAEHQRMIASQTRIDTPNTTRDVADELREIDRGREVGQQEPAPRGVWQN